MPFSPNRELCMRRERLFLRDIVEAADAIRDFVSGHTEQTFLQSELLRSAVVQKLTIIGEAAARLPSELKQRYAAIPWAEIAGFRNILVHAYFGIQWDIVWRAATEEVPQLREQVSAVLLAEFGEEV
jgi:uncharacterized protein with HEPN domain